MSGCGSTFTNSSLQNRINFIVKNLRHHVIWYLRLHTSTQHQFCLLPILFFPLGDKICLKKEYILACISATVCIPHSTADNINLKAPAGKWKEHPQCALSEPPLVCISITRVFVFIRVCLWQNVPVTELRNPVFLHVTYTRDEWTR